MQTEDNIEAVRQRLPTEEITLHVKGAVILSTETGGKQGGETTTQTTPATSTRADDVDTDIPALKPAKSGKAPKGAAGKKA